MNYQPIAISKELHRKAKMAALREGVTLKAWTERLIIAALDGKRLVDTPEPYRVKEAS